MHRRRGERRESPPTTPPTPSPRYGGNYVGIVRPDTKAEEELLARMDERIWTETFDPIQPLLQGLSDAKTSPEEEEEDEDEDGGRPRMPGSGNAGEDRYLETAMADADLGSEIVLSRLGKHVQAHYEELIEVRPGGGADG